jgi:hypothetical protein
MQQISTIGLDLAKQVFQVHAAAADGAPILNRKLRRAEVLRFFEKTPACLVGMEACGSAHYWAREIRPKAEVGRADEPPSASYAIIEQHRASSNKFGGKWRAAGNCLAS